MSTMPIMAWETAEFLADGIMSEYLRPIYYDTNNFDAVIAVRNNFKNIYLTASWSSSWRGVMPCKHPSILHGSLEKWIRAKELTHDIPNNASKHMKNIFKYHAWFAYLETKFIEWQKNCKGHTETFYRELPKVVFKTLFLTWENTEKRHYACLFWKSSTKAKKIGMISKYSEMQHKSPTHIDQKFYKWLTSICIELLLLKR